MGGDVEVEIGGGEGGECGEEDGEEDGEGLGEGGEGGGELRDVRDGFSVRKVGIWGCRGAHLARVKDEG